MRLSKFLTILAVALAASVSSTATAQLQPKTGIEPKLFDRTARTITEFYPSVRTLSTAGLCTITSTNGTLLPISATRRGGPYGYIVSNAEASITGMTVTTSIAAMAYAGKVQIGIMDQSSDTTPICSGYRICGDLWNGQPKCEEVVAGPSTVLSESTRVISTYAYSRITSARVSSCSGWDADDALIVRSTPHLAMNYRIGGSASTVDMLSVCVTHLLAGTGVLHCATPSQLSVDTAANTVNVLDDAFSMGSDGTSCPQDRSSFTIKYRASPNATTY